jgi:hypothetical protein
MAVKERKHLVDQLLKYLGDVPVSYDEGFGIWENRKRAMLMYDKDSDFHCVLQDDAVPCANFYNEVKKIVGENRATSLYFGNRKNMLPLAQKAEKMGGIETDWLSWGVGIVLPTKIIPHLIEYWEKTTGYERHDDTRISKYLRHIGMKVYYPMPSLVDHRHEVKSLMDSDEGVKLRRAYKFKG